MGDYSEIFGGIEGCAVFYVPEEKSYTLDFYIETDNEIKKSIALRGDMAYNNPTDGILSMPYVIGENLWHGKNFRI